MKTQSSLVSLSDYEKEAKIKTNKNAFDYYQSGAGNEFSLNLNNNYFNKLRIRPRCLVDVTKRNLSCEIFGIRLGMPLGVSPTAMQKMAHPQGECANAIACGKQDLLFILSTIATSSIEEVAKAAPNTKKWFQLYIYIDRKLTESLVRRAEQNNYLAIVLTVDTPLFGLRRADMRNKFTLSKEYQLANFTGEFASGVQSKHGGSGLNEYVDGKFDPSLTWDDVKWLVSFTKLPVILKGILTREDALLAVECGCKGIIVSNHGARQLDTVPATIEALPEIIKAVNNRLVVMLDGGIREGTDIFKALALGAKMVFIGRPPIWGLAVNGEQGVEHIFKILKHEFDVTMALTGCQTVDDIKREMVIHESYYSKL